MDLANWDVEVLEREHLSRAVHCVVFFGVLRGDVVVIGQVGGRLVVIEVKGVLLVVELMVVTEDEWICELRLTVIGIGAVHVHVEGHLLRGHRLLMLPGVIDHGLATFNPFNHRRCRVVGKIEKVRLI